MAVADYWHSVLFKQLVGTNVLDIEGSTATGERGVALCYCSIDVPCLHVGRMTRVYAFCARNISGGVTVLAININLTPTSFTFQSDFPMYPRLVCRLVALCHVSLISFRRLFARHCM